MALKDSLANFFDNVGLKEAFSKPAFDADKARKPLLKGIANTRKQFEEGRTKAPHRWWDVSNGVVALTVKVGGEVFTINKVDTNHMPAERFPEFLTKFEKAVGDGEFDEELKNHGHGDATVHIAKERKARTPRDPDAPKAEKAGWSDERRERFAASIAARKAAKAGG